MDAELSRFFTDFYSGAGGEVDECSIMLRFFGDTLEPESISALLGIQPTEWCRKDKLRSSGQPGAWQTGYWLLDCERTADTADNQIKLLLENDLPNDLAIWQSLSVNFIAEIEVHLSLARWAEGRFFRPQLSNFCQIAGSGFSSTFTQNCPPWLSFQCRPNRRKNDVATSCHFMVCGDSKASFAPLF